MGACLCVCFMGVCVCETSVSAGLVVGVWPEDEAQSCGPGINKW